MMLAIPSRRLFLTGSGALLLAPAIVRASSLMSISTVPQSIPVMERIDLARYGDLRGRLANFIAANREALAGLNWRYRESYELDAFREAV